MSNVRNNQPTILGDLASHEVKALLRPGIIAESGTPAKVIGTVLPERVIDTLPPLSIVLVPPPWRIVGGVRCGYCAVVKALRPGSAGESSHSAEWHTEPEIATQGRPRVDGMMRWSASRGGPGPGPYEGEVSNMGEVESALEWLRFSHVEAEWRPVAEVISVLLPSFRDVVLRRVALERPSMGERTANRMFLLFDGGQCDLRELPWPLRVALALVLMHLDARPADRQNKLVVVDRFAEGLSAAQTIRLVAAIVRAQGLSAHGLRILGVVENETPAADFPSTAVRVLRADTTGMAMALQTLAEAEREGGVIPCGAEVSTRLARFVLA